MRLFYAILLSEEVLDALTTRRRDCARKRWEEGFRAARIFI